ncbi:HPP family protein [Antrihabitans sp. NCIMB 15449]|uniref:CBS domain-containing protein n=2 Tax=Antrihabitans TaxID=2799491 RepID=A0A934NV74_9NOCA|nr:CBS domain-containing protein [Antrihabitans stalagmiti]MBJ8341888.1 CBS domain-containing protein [Antrihabitans stalagmiti]
MPAFEFPMRNDPEVESIRALDLMTSPVVTLRDGARLSEVLETILASGVATLPVVSTDGTLIALVTEESVAKAEMLGLWSGRFTWSDITLSKRMTAAVFHFAEPATSVGPAARLSEIVDQMLEKRLRSIPVVDDGNVIGMVGWREIFAALVRLHSNPPYSTS